MMPPKGFSGAFQALPGVVESAWLRLGLQDACSTQDGRRDLSGLPGKDPSLPVSGSREDPRGIERCPLRTGWRRNMARNSQLIENKHESLFRYAVTGVTLPTKLRCVHVCVHVYVLLSISLFVTNIDR